MENTCTICFEGDDMHNLCTLKCSHTFHFDCLIQWYQNTLLYDSGKFDFPCPYCRQFIVVSEIPQKYDVFYKFYFFTKFKRSKCSINNCSHLEFPLNDGVCSKHMYPFIDKNDLLKIMNHIFEFFYMPLNIRKYLIYIGKSCIYKNIPLDDLMSQIKNLIYKELNTYEIGIDYLPTYHIYLLLKDFARENQFLLINNQI
jgi:hypothetical protein